MRKTRKKRKKSRKWGNEGERKKDEYVQRTREMTEQELNR
jgi:hypothetical protein